MEILNVKNLNKSFGKKKILNNVSFTMEEGDILGFIGPNGAGKTTTIKLILGLQNMNSGQVVINSYDNKKDFEKALASVGSIIESPDMYMYLSGYQNLKLIAQMYDNISEARIREMVKLVGLEKSINLKVSKYSLGMRQRLGIAGALLNDPKLLVFDEPTNGLDPEGIKELRTLFKRLAKQKKAILVSSHNLSELETFCNKVCIIKKGQVLIQKDIKDFKKKNLDNTYVLETDNNNKAAELLNGEVIDSVIEFKTNSLNEALEKLIKIDINILSVNKKELSLEDAFIEMAGGMND